MKEEPQANNHKDSVIVVDAPEPTNHLDRSRDSRDDSLSEVAEFSDDDDDIPLGKGTVPQIYSRFPFVAGCEQFVSGWAFFCCSFSPGD